MTSQPATQSQLPAIQGFVGGQPAAFNSGRGCEVFNPATGKPSGWLAFASTEEVDKAVAAAAAAFPAWADTPPLRRAEILFRFKALLDKHRDDIARHISNEHGKTHDDALGEVARGIEVVDYACGIPSLLKGEFSRNVGPNIDTIAEREPLGVVAGITPFNFPAMVPMWMYPMAIASGNTFVLKPSERDPSAPLFVNELLQQAGLPEGVMNIVHGDKVAVDALLNNPQVKAISFVGSTPVAEYIYATGTANGKRVQALGGAKNHMLIMPDADIKQAADALMGAAFGSAGERCMAISVAVPVGEETADKLVAALREQIGDMTVGAASEANSDMGPLITAQHRDKVAGFIKAGADEGADVVVDGRNHPITTGPGSFLGATLLDKVKPGMSVYEQEIFGPVLSVVRAQTYAEAIDLVNNHEYGNGVSIFTRDGGVARDFTRRVDVGMVGVNVPIPVPVAYHSFGGFKRSLFGDHSIYGPEGVHFYTKLKTITQRWPDNSRQGPEFVFPTNR